MKLFLIALTLIAVGCQTGIAVVDDPIVEPIECSYCTDEAQLGYVSPGFCLQDYYGNWATTLYECSLGHEWLEVYEANLSPF